MEHCEYVFFQYLYIVRSSFYHILFWFEDDTFNIHWGVYYSNISRILYIQIDKIGPKMTKNTASLRETN